MTTELQESWREIYNNFKVIYPKLSKKSTYFCPHKYMSILIYFTDGTKMVYDDVRKQARLSV